MTKPFRKPPDFDLVTDLREARLAAQIKVNSIGTFIATAENQLAHLHQTIADIEARRLTAPADLASAKAHLARLDQRLAEATEKSKPRAKPTIIERKSPLDLLIDKLKAGDISVIPQIQALTRAART